MPTSTPSPSPQSHLSPTRGSISLAKGATARSAVHRSSPSKSKILAANAVLNGTTRSHKKDELLKLEKKDLVALVERLEGERDETSEAREEERRQMEKLQEKLIHLEVTISNLESQNSAVAKDLELSEERSRELFAEGSRLEEEFSRKFAVQEEVLEKLRSRLNETEKKNKENERRYKEQSESFDSERQTWVSKEAHLKLLLDDLLAKQKTSSIPINTESIPEDEEDTRSLKSTKSKEAQGTATKASLRAMGEEVEILKGQLESLGMNNEMLESSRNRLIQELLEVKKLNYELMEVNESYEVLLGERTFEARGGKAIRDLLEEVKKLGGISDIPEGIEVGDDEDDLIFEHESTMSDIQMAEGEAEIDELDRILLETSGEGKAHQGAVAARLPSSPLKTKRRGGNGIEKRRGKSSMGPNADGVNLAEELERAGEEEGEKEKAFTEEAMKEEAQKLKDEISSLKDANKALALYISNILERIIAKGGFEEVLAADYADPPASPKKNSAFENVFNKEKYRSQSVDGSLPVTPETPNKGLKGFFGFGARTESHGGVSSIPMGDPSKSEDRLLPVPDIRANKRRSMSIDWLRNPFAKSSAPVPSPEMNGRFKPLISPTPEEDTLKEEETSKEEGTPNEGDSPKEASEPPARSVTNAITGGEEEDEEDKREREKLNADLALHGIYRDDEAGITLELGTTFLMSDDQPIVPEKTQYAQSTSTTSKSERRKSIGFFGRFSSSSSSSTPVGSTASLVKEEETHEQEIPLSPAEVIKNMEIREENMKKSIMSGGAGGFTEPVKLHRRLSSRSRRHSGAHSIGGSSMPGSNSGSGGEEGNLREPIGEEEEEDSENKEINENQTQPKVTGWPRAMKRMSFR